MTYAVNPSGADVAAFAEKTAHEVIEVILMAHQYDAEEIACMCGAKCGLVGDDMTWAGHVADELIENQSLVGIIGLARNYGGMPA